MTALYVTHDQSEAVVLGDRVGVMRDGKLLQMAAPNEIYNRPADLFVANFTGASNELAGTLIARNGEFGTVDLGGGQAPKPRCWRRSRRRRGAHRVAAENIGLGRRDGANTFEARVIDRRYQGTQTAYDIDLLGRRLEALELGTAARHDVGTTTSVSLPREALWAFRDTGAGGRRVGSLPSPRRGEGGERSEPGEGRSVIQLEHIGPLTPALSHADRACLYCVISLHRRYLAIGARSKASWQVSDKVGDQASAHGRDRVWNVSLRPQWRSLWVDNRRERQIPGRARRRKV